MILLSTIVKYILKEAMMNENKRLLQWMKEKDFSIDTLAEALGVSYSTIYMQTRGGRSVSAETKWRFASHFGMEEARKVFDAPQVAAIAA